MRTPSSAAGAHGLTVVLLLAVILFVGFALVPRAFEFQAWPQPTRQDMAEEVVARSAQEATEVPVVRVRSAKRSGRKDALAVRGRKPRRGASDGGALAVRSDRGSSSPRVDSPPTGGGSRQQAPSGPPAAVVEVPDAPAPQPDAPVEAPERPAQLAEVPETDLVLRAGADRYAPADEAEAGDESDVEAQADWFASHYEPRSPARHGRHGRR